MGRGGLTGRDEVAVEVDGWFGRRMRKKKGRLSPLAGATGSLYPPHGERDVEQGRGRQGVWTDL